MTPTSYSETIKKMLDLTNPQRGLSERKPDIPAHMRRVLSALGVAPRGKFAHIAGSKGKTSLATMLAAILTASGVPNLLFTSPALHKMTERFQINSAPVSEALLGELAERVLSARAGAGADSPLNDMTLFEMLTALMFTIMRARELRFGVVEVGVGGRMDATNIIAPEVAVIQPIEYDHRHILGDSIAAIAREKAGVIKAGAPAVVGRQPPAALRELRAAADRQSTELILAEERAAVERVEPDAPGGARVAVATARATYRFKLNMAGAQQVDNARVAIVAAEVLSQRGFAVGKAAIERGLSAARLDGRLQTVRSLPQPFIADGCHTALSADALLDYIAATYPAARQKVVIVGCTEGHENATVVQTLLKLRPRFIATQSRHPRAVPADELGARIKGGGGAVVAVAPSVKDAVKLARAQTDADLLVACGSLAVAAEAIQAERGLLSDF